MRKAIVAVVTASGLMFGSSAEAANSARSPSVMNESDNIAGNPWVPWVFALAALVAIVLVVTDDDEDEPVSP